MRPGPREQARERLFLALSHTPAVRTSGVRLAGRDLPLGTRVDTCLSGPCGPLDKTARLRPSPEHAEEDWALRGLRKPKGSAMPSDAPPGGWAASSLPAAYPSPDPGLCY